MAKIPSGLYLTPKDGLLDTSLVYDKKGFIAAVARRLHPYIKTQWVFNLGWGFHEVDISQPIGKVVSYAEDGKVIVRIGGISKDSEQ